jgi:outer membrane protein assembly factor BamB
MMTGWSGRAAVRWVALALAPLWIAGCSDSLPSMPKLGDLNPFAEKEVPLPGKRIPIVAATDGLPGDMVAADQPVVLPPQQTNSSWSQPGGAPNNALGHLALNAAVKQTWSADAGTGSSSGAKLTASPIVYEGRVFTLDTNAEARAFSVSGGGMVWKSPLRPEAERGKGGFGGGLAAENGRIYAATGFGTVVALDAQSGKKIWEKSLGVTIRASPTVSAGRVFVVASDGRAFCLSGTDGAELWVYRGLPERTSLIFNPSPAVAGDIALLPFPSGELVAVRVTDGSPIWTESLARARQVSSIASMSDAGRPVVDGDTAFAVGHAGRMIATRVRNGERLWQLSIPSIQMPWAAGQSIFVVDTQGQLIAVNRRDGKVVWTTKLPGGGTWSGPTLAGGQLWLVSNKGQMVGVEAATGKVASTVSIGNPAYIAPVVADGRLYVMTDNGRLVAYN